LENPGKYEGRKEGKIRAGGDGVKGVKGRKGKKAG
jgi:hypothetical protein